MEQVRVALHPALERPWQAVVAGGGGVAQPEELRSLGYVKQEGALMPTAPAPMVAGSVADSATTTYEREADAMAKVARKAVRSDYAPDPDARVPTGPGRPEWTWQEVSLAWSGPVARDQELRLWLLPPPGVGARR